MDKDVIGYDKLHKPTEKPNVNETTNATRKSVNTLTLPDGMVLIPYHADEHSLLNTDVTQKLIDNINSMQTMPTFEMPKLDVKELVRNGSEGNQDVIIKDIGGIHPYHADEHSLLNTDVTQKLIDNMNSMQTMPTFEMPKLDVKELVRNGSEGNPDVIIKDIGGIHVYDATDPNAIMGVIHKNIKTVAKDVGTVFSKNVSKVGNKRTWG